MVEAVEAQRAERDLARKPAGCAGFDAAGEFDRRGREGGAIACDALRLPGDPWQVFSEGARGEVAADEGGAQRGGGAGCVDRCDSRQTEL